MAAAGTGPRRAAGAPPSPSPSPVGVATGRSGSPVLAVARLGGLLFRGGHDQPGLSPGPACAVAGAGAAAAAGSGGSVVGAGARSGSLPTPATLAPTPLFTPSAGPAPHADATATAGMAGAAKASASGGGRRGGGGGAEANTFRDVERLQRVAQFTSGALAGLVNTLVLSPLDVVKTRLQTQGAAGSVARYTGVGNTLRMILREEGALSYYKGLSASLWAFVPNWAIYWFTYEELKRRLGVNAMAAAQSSGARGPGGTPGQRESRLLPFAYMASAVGAGAVTAVTTAPFWVVKTRMQLDMAVGANRRYTSVPDGFRKIVAEEGFASLYKGLTPTLLGLVHVGVQFPLYERIKSWLSRGQEEELTAGHLMLAASVSKLTASVAAYPHEVVRTKLQVDATSLRALSHGGARPSELHRARAVLSQILREEGPRGLYRGLTSNLLRTVPACMLTFTSYELAKRYFGVVASQYKDRERVRGLERVEVPARVEGSSSASSGAAAAAAAAAAAVQAGGDLDREALSAAPSAASPIGLPRLPSSTSDTPVPAVVRGR
ncbi:hypothetical protein MMPV_008164 [Pyropia vietnamensis]